MQRLSLRSFDVVPECNHMDPYKREAKGDLTKESRVRTEAGCYSAGLETRGKGDNQGMKGMQTFQHLEFTQ